ncbi:MAG: response regulator [Archangium sp.]
MKVDAFQAGLLCTTAALPELEEGLRALELVWPPLERVELCTDATTDSMVALLDFGNRDHAQTQLPRLRALCTLVDGRVIEALELPAQRAQHPMRARGAVTQAFDAMRPRLPSPMRVSFDSQEAFLAAWATQVAEGGMKIDQQFRPSVTFSTPQGDYAGNRAVRLEDGRVEVAAGVALTRLLHRVANERRDTRPRPIAVRTPTPTPNHLEVRFERVRDLAVRYATELRLGSLVVPCEEPPPLHTRLELRLTLPTEEIISVGAEVVEVLPDAVKVWLFDVTPETFEPIDRLLSHEQERRPRVLVIDDEAIWRSSLVRMLKELDCDIVLACDGHEGLVKLIDGYFDLDLVILDLHMPQLDGRTVLDRVRRLGGDAALRMILFSATNREELAEIGSTTMVSAVFSKLDPIDKLAERVAKELGLTCPWQANAEISVAG